MGEYSQKNIHHASELQLAVEALKLVVFQIDGEGAITYLNSYWERLVNLPASDCIGKSLYLFFHPRHRYALESLNHSTASEADQQLELQLNPSLNLAAKPKWVRLHIGQAQNSGSSRMGTLTDITRDQAAKIRAEAQEYAIQAIIRETSGLYGQMYFEKVVSVIGKLMHADYTFIGLWENKGSVTTIAMDHQGEVAPNFSYTLAGTPCCNLKERGTCIYNNNVADLFPEDILLAEMEIKGYVGTALHDSKGNILGVFVSLFKAPLSKDDSYTASYVFELFANNIASEIERTQQELQIKQSRGQLKAVLENTDDIILSLDKEYKLLTINHIGKEALKEALNIEIKEGDTLTEIIPEKHQQILAKHYEDCLRGESQQVTDEFTDQEGNSLFRETSYNPIRQDGEVTGVSIVSRNITEQVNAQKKLQESEEWNRSIINVLTEGIVLHDATGKVILYNSSAPKILGISPDQLIGTTPMDPQWECIKENGEPFPGEEHPASFTLSTGLPLYKTIMGVKTPGSKLRWIMINSIPVNNPSTGALKAVAVSFSNITEIKEANFKYKESEKRYRLLAEHSVDVISRHSVDSSYTYASPAILHLIGYEPAHIIGDNPINYVHPKDANRVATAYKSFSTQENKAQRVTYRIKHRNGHHIWVESIGKLIRYDKGKREVIVLTRDISERKTTELALLASEQEKGNILMALDNAALVSITDLNGVIKHANPKFCEVSGYSYEELVGSPHSIVNSGHHEEAFWAEMWQTITSGSPWRGEVKNQTQLGEYYWVDTVITPIQNADGKVYEYMSVRYLITEKKALYEHREKLIKDLEDYAHMTSHQLRGPLARMLGLTNLIVDGHIRPEEFKKIIQMIKETSEELDSIIRKMNKVLGRTLYNDE